MTASYIQGAVYDLANILVRKNKDYAPGDEFSNFIGAAQFAGIRTDEAIMSQLGIKWTRLESLMETGAKPENESIEDNLMDLAGYALILVGFLRYVAAFEEAADESIKDGEEKGYL